jgi:predicted nucleic acid-binding protein
VIAVDSSLLVAWLDQVDVPETRRLNELAGSGTGVLAPVTITELLSDPRGRTLLNSAFANFPVIALTQGYWERAGLLRSQVRRAKRKAVLGDALIAQACIDADIALLTLDADFEAFAKIGGLKLA